MQWLTWDFQSKPVNGHRKGGRGGKGARVTNAAQALHDTKRYRKEVIRYTTFSVSFDPKDGLRMEGSTHELAKMMVNWTLLNARAGFNLSKFRKRSDFHPNIELEVLTHLVLVDLVLAISVFRCCSKFYLLCY